MSEDGNQEVIHLTIEEQNLVAVLQQQAQMEARRRNAASRGVSSDPSPESSGQIPTMQTSAQSFIGQVYGFVSNEPFCCQIFFYACVLSILGTAFELAPYTRYSLQLILEKEEYWRIFTWPLAGEGVLSNFFSVLFAYYYLKTVEQTLGSCFTSISFLSSFLFLSFIPLAFYPLCSPKNGILSLEQITMAGFWGITFFIYSLSIIPNIHETTWFLCFRFRVSKKINIILLCIFWQVLTLGDMGSILGTLYGFILIYGFPNWRNIQRLDTCFCCFRKTEAFMTLDPFAFKLRERLDKEKRVKKRHFGREDQRENRDKSGLIEMESVSEDDEARHLMSSNKVENRQNRSSSSGMIAD
jgi:membrane associated rhomboid family serine protease